MFNKQRWHLNPRCKLWQPHCKLGAFSTMRQNLHTGHNSTLLWTSTSAHRCIWKPKQSDRETKCIWRVFKCHLAWMTWVQLHLMFHLHPANMYRASSLWLWPIWALSVKSICAHQTQPGPGLEVPQYHTKGHTWVTAPPLEQRGSWANLTVLGQTIKIGEGEYDLLTIYYWRLSSFVLYFPIGDKKGKGIFTGGLLISLLLGLLKRKLLPSFYFCPFPRLFKRHSPSDPLWDVTCLLEVSQL